MMSHADSADTAKASACHYALQCPDILNIVFETMYPLSNITDQAACASCARVCRAFHPSATRALWSVLRDLWPLWRILRPASHMWNKPAKNDPYFAAILEDKPYLDPIVWECFLRCAARVKGLNTIYGFASNQARVCRVLARHNGGKTFLPSLQRLVWVQDRICGSDLLVLLAPPTLRKLLLRYHYSSNADSPDDSNTGSDSDSEPDEDQVRATENILSSVATQCPFLHTLHIGSSFIKTSSLLPDLLLFRRLCTLDIATAYCSSSVIFTPSDLRTLTQTLLLQDLSITIGGFRQDHSSNTGIDCPDLEALLCAGTFADVAGLAACLRAPALTTVHITGSDEDAMQASDLQVFFAAALSPEFSNSLRALSISPRREGNIHPALRMADSMSLSDVLQCRPALSRIEDLRLTFIPGTFLLSLTDEDVLVLARAMPCIRHLDLTCFVLESRVPSLLTLLHFATYCSRLRVLRLDGLEGGPVPVLAAAPTSGHALEELHLSRARTVVTEPAALAAMLVIIFPNMVQFTPPWAHISCEGSVEGWKAVSEELVSLWLQRKERAVDPYAGARVCVS